MQKFIFIFILCSFGCAAKTTPTKPVETDATPTDLRKTPSDLASDLPTDLASIVAVETTGSDDVQFSVTVQSPDTGCDRYADWWEVITTDGALLYRRILQHSHVDEQPFTRSGGPVSLPAGDVIVRVHMKPDGYSVSAMRGNPTDGFRGVQLESGFAESLEREQPLPTSCAF